jgi:hypothetical protein
MGLSTHSSMSSLKLPMRFGNLGVETVAWRSCSIEEYRGCGGWIRDRERHWTRTRRLAARHMEDVFIVIVFRSDVGGAGKAETEMESRFKSARRCDVT